VQGVTHARTLGVSDSGYTGALLDPTDGGGGAIDAHTSATLETTDAQCMAQARTLGMCDSGYFGSLLDPIDGGDCTTNAHVSAALEEASAQRMAHARPADANGSGYLSALLGTMLGDGNGTADAHVRAALEAAGAQYVARARTPSVSDSDYLSALFASMLGGGSGATDSPASVPLETDDLHVSDSGYISALLGSMLGGGKGAVLEAQPLGACSGLFGKDGGRRFRSSHRHLDADYFPGLLCMSRGGWDARIATLLHDSAQQSSVAGQMLRANDKCDHTAQHPRDGALLAMVAWLEMTSEALSTQQTQTRSTTGAAHGDALLVVVARLDPNASPTQQMAFAVDGRGSDSGGVQGRMGLGSAGEAADPVQASDPSLDARHDGDAPGRGGQRSAREDADPSRVVAIPTLVTPRTLAYDDTDSCSMLTVQTLGIDQRSSHDLVATPSIVTSMGETLATLPETRSTAAGMAAGDTEAWIACGVVAGDAEARIAREVVAGDTSATTGNERAPTCACALDVGGCSHNSLLGLADPDTNRMLACMIRETIDAHGAMHWLGACRGVRHDMIDAMTAAESKMMRVRASSDALRSLLGRSGSTTAGAASLTIGVEHAPAPKPALTWAMMTADAAR
jgi:hypothetical protein